MSIIAFLYGLCCIIYAEKHGWLALRGIEIITSLAIPTFLLNIIVNILLKTRRFYSYVQFLLVTIVLCLYYCNTGLFGMPFINSIRNFINNHSSNTIDTAQIETFGLEC